MQRLRTLLLASVMGAFALTAPAALAQEDAELATENAWVTGNLIFLAYHEVGHLILDQAYRIDQNANRLGAEQSADDIATWLLSPDPEDVDEYHETIVAIEGWLQSADQRSSDGPWDNPHYPDDVTRAARIACLLYGSDETSPNTFEALVDVVSLAFEPSACQRDYAKLEAALESVFGDTDNTRNNPVARVSVRYEQAGPALEEAADFLRESGVLEGLRDDLVTSVGLPIDVSLVGASCGPQSSGFLYSASRRQITACYEEVDWFLFGDATESDDAAGAETAGDELGSRPRRQAPLPVRPPPPPRRPR